MKQNQSEKTSSGFWTLTKHVFSGLHFILQLIFPSLILLKVNSLVAKASFTKDPWFKAQSARGFKTALLLLVPSFVALFYAKTIIIADQGSYNRIFERASVDYKHKQFKKALKDVTQGFDELPLKSIGLKVFLALLVPSTISVYLRSTNTILRGTKTLRKILSQNNFGQNGEIGVAVYYPVGVLIDITGHSPKDVLTHKYLWTALNIQIDEQDWHEDPQKRSVVFFKKNFVLAQEYRYNLTDAKKILNINS